MREDNLFKHSNKPGAKGVDEFDIGVLKPLLKRQF